MTDMCARLRSKKMTRSHKCGSFRVWVWCFPSLYFFQNGAIQNPQAAVLDGQGHITAVHLQSRTVSELVVPAPRIRVTLTDMMQRRYAKAVWLGMWFESVMHTGTANTAVRESAQGIVAVEEFSKPFRLNIVDCRLASGEWLFRQTPSAVHAMDGLEFAYRPYGRTPLVANGESIPWPLDTYPVLVHSAARTADLYVFPILSTRVGNWRRFLSNELPMPLREDANFEWLIYNTTTKRSYVVDTGATCCTLCRQGEFDARSVRVCHVKDLSALLQSKRDEYTYPRFELRKDRIDLAKMALTESTHYPEASGDFPNPVNDSVVLINILENTTHQKVVFFDIDSEAVVKKVVLPHSARDVLHYENHLLYCTLDLFCIYELEACRNVVELPIPE